MHVGRKGVIWPRSEFTLDCVHVESDLAKSVNSPVEVTVSEVPYVLLPYAGA